MTNQAKKIADKLIKEHEFDGKSFFCNQPEDERIFVVVRHAVCHLSPETLGRIVGRDSKTYDLYSVHCGTWLSKYDSGLDLLHTIAITVVVAAMAEQVHQLSQAA